MPRGGSDVALVKADRQVFYLTQSLSRIDQSLFSCRRLLRSTRQALSELRLAYLTDNADRLSAPLSVDHGYRTIADIALSRMSH